MGNEHTKKDHFSEKEFVYHRLGQKKNRADIFKLKHSTEPYFGTTTTNEPEGQK
jgi:hypothetical protein